MSERPALDRWLAEADELVRGGDDCLPDGMRCRPAGERDLSDDDEARVERMNVTLRQEAISRVAPVPFPEYLEAEWVRRSWTACGGADLASPSSRWAADCPKCSTPVRRFEAFRRQEAPNVLRWDLYVSYFQPTPRRYILAPCGHTVESLTLRQIPAPPATAGTSRPARQVQGW